MVVIEVVLDPGFEECLRVLDGPEGQGDVQCLHSDVDKVRTLQQRRAQLAVGQREGTGGVAGWFFRTVFGRRFAERVVDGGDPLVDRDLPPHRECESATRAEGSTDVSESCGRVTE